MQCLKYLETHLCLCQYENFVISGNILAIYVKGTHNSDMCHLCHLCHMWNKLTNGYISAGNSRNAKKISTQSI